MAATTQLTSFLNIALDCIARGWHVHPLKPGGKIPITKHGKNDATLDEAQVRAWWTDNSTCNVGISCGPSGLCVLDADHGLKDEADFIAWRDRNGLPVTYAVRSGRRDEFGVQSYYFGILPDGRFELDGVKGDIKSAGGLVLAAGDIHPVTGEAYYVLVDAPPAPVPPLVDQCRVRKQTSATPDGGDITEGRNIAMTSILGKMRDVGFTDELLRDYAVRINEERMKPPLDDDELERIVQNACKWPIPAPEPVITIGSGKSAAPEPPKDWRTDFHSYEEMENAPDPAFLIEGWLQLDSITAIAAPVGQRKSLIALNVAWALCTREPLFDHFAVTQQPTRVLYLCPEMGLGTFTKRLRAIGLLPYVGKTLFCRTMSVDQELTLDELTPEALAGAVVIIDTAVRYLKGDENKSEDMRAFAKSIFRLTREGATVLLLHHSAKGTKEAGELTLENAMRGSGELGAFLYCCWATRLQDPSEPYQSASYITNVKQRDFSSKPFEVTSGPDCRLHIVQDPETATVTLQARSAFKGNKDGKDEAALAFVKANVKVSNVKLSAMLKEAEMPRSAEWIRKRKYDLLQANGGMMP